MEWATSDREFHCMCRITAESTEAKNAKAKNTKAKNTGPQNTGLKDTEQELIGEQNLNDKESGTDSNEDPQSVRYFQSRPSASRTMTTLTSTRPKHPKTTCKLCATRYRYITKVPNNSEIRSKRSSFI